VFFLIKFASFDVEIEKEYIYKPTPNYNGYLLITLMNSFKGIFGTQTLDVDKLVDICL